MTASYLLDTNVLSDLIRNPSGRAIQRIRALRETELCTSVIVAAELRYGCAKKGSPELTRRVEALLTVLPVISFEAPADRYYGRVRAELEASGQLIGQNDLLIAAHALALGATIVTANDREFRRVAGLRVENWVE